MIYLYLIIQAKPSDPINLENSTNDLLLQHVKDAADECRQKEEEMKKMTDKIIESSKSNYKFKTRANLILVIVGVILIANPIAFTWLKSFEIIDTPKDDMDNDMDLTNLNYFLGGIGIVAFVTTFFNRPQKQMTIAIGDLAQLLFICMMFQVQFHTLLGRVQEEIMNKSRKESADKYNCVKDTNEELYVITNRTVQLIEDCVKKYAKDKSKSNESGKSTFKEKASKWMDG
jgi:hypothetical protein